MGELKGINHQSCAVIRNSFPRRISLGTYELNSTVATNNLRLLHLFDKIGSRTKIGKYSELADKIQELTNDSRNVNKTLVSCLLKP